MPDHIFLMPRGVSGSGKTTFCRRYVSVDRIVSSDDLRFHQHGDRLLDDQGHVLATQDSENQLRDLIAERLETLMQDGDVVVLDGAHASTYYMPRWLEIAKRHGYQTYIIDFTDVPFELCEERNAQREFQRRVPKRIMERQRQYIKECQLPEGVTVLTPEAAANLLTT